MSTKFESAKRIANGTHGEAWVDGEKVAETSACQAKVSYDKTEIKLCGEMMTDTKRVGAKGTGSLTLHKVDSGLAMKMGRLDVDQRFTIISKLKEPDSFGAERVALYGISFDDLTLADWQAATAGSVAAPFTFTSYEYLDMIEVR